MPPFRAIFDPSFMPVVLNSDLVPHALRPRVEEIVRKHYHQPLEIEWRNVPGSGKALLELPDGLVGPMAGAWDPLEPVADATPLMSRSIDQEIHDFIGH
jgi:hypothetical protein